MNDRHATDPPQPLTDDAMNPPPDFSPSDPPLDSPSDIWDDPRITAAAVGQLDADDQAEFDRRIVGDPAVAAAVAEARKIAAELEQHFASEPVPAAALRTPLGPSDPPVVTPNPTPQIKRRRLGLAIAAGLAAVAVGAATIPIGRVPVALETTFEPTGEQSPPGDRSPSPPNDQIDPPSSAEPPVTLQFAGRSPEKTATESASDANAVVTDASEIKDGLIVAEQTREERLSDEQVSNGRVSVPPLAASDQSGRNQPMMGGEESMGAGGMMSMGRRGMMGTAPASTESYGDSPAAPSRANVQFQIRGRARVGQPPTQMQVRQRIFPHVPARLGLEPGRGLESRDDDRSRFDASRDRFESETRHEFRRTSEQPLSTFSIDVDTASFAKVRSMLREGLNVPPSAVRVEEFINAMDYDYPPLEVDARSENGDRHPLSVHTETVVCPWQPEHRITRIGVQSQTVAPEDRKAANLVFLVDRSGSMSDDPKLPLVIDGLKMMARRLRGDDRVSIVTYASGVEVIADGVAGDDARRLRRALGELSAGGSTNGSGGILMAYDLARKHFAADGVNRVILCTDGDFNVGVTGDESLVDMVARQSAGGIELTVLGVGHGNLNDAMLEQISGRGNGTYGFLDDRREARRWFVDRLTTTLQTIAKDVKIQIEFNPAVASSYRLIGYENRVLAARDFNDDRKDAGEIGAGHQVTALYQWVPAGSDSDPSDVDPLRYAAEDRGGDSAAAITDEVAWVKLRYKRPGETSSVKFEQPIAPESVATDRSDASTRLAMAAAAIAMRLADDPAVTDFDLDDIERLIPQDRTGDTIDDLVDILDHLPGDRRSP